MDHNFIGILPSSYFLKRHDESLLTSNNDEASPDNNFKGSSLIFLTNDKFLKCFSLPCSSNTLSRFPDTTLNDKLLKHFSQPCSCNVLSCSSDTTLDARTHSKTSLELTTPPPPPPHAYHSDEREINEVKIPIQATNQENPKDGIIRLILTNAEPNQKR